jgi:hypothetical protein
MPSLFIGDQDTKVWPVDRQPFNGDVSVKLRAATEPLLDRVREAAKRNPRYNAHHETVKGKRKLVPANQAGAYSEELVKALVEDFSGVTALMADTNSVEEIACTDEPVRIILDGEPVEILPKLLLMKSPVLIDFIVEKAQLMAQVNVEEEQKN